MNDDEITKVEEKNTRKCDKHEKERGKNRWNLFYLCKKRREGSAHEIFLEIKDVFLYYNCKMITKVFIIQTYLISVSYIIDNFKN